MSESNSTDDFLEAYRKDLSEGSVRLVEDYHSQFPSVMSEVIRGVLEGNMPDATVNEAPIASEAGVLQQVGPYKILKELGRGGQGVVFLAEDTRLGRRVALKVLTSWSQASPKMIARFQREAAIASRLDHPGICTVYETGMADGAPFMAMRFVEGISLAGKVRVAARADLPPDSSFMDLEHDTEEHVHKEEVTSGPTAGFSTGLHGTQTAIAEIVRLLEKTARALHVAHDAGVIHRDIKPANIMITSGSEPVILDFGLARDIEGEDQTLTQTGDIFGTPAYMSPEQLLGKRASVDRRADVWSLGVTLFECLALRHPFHGATRDALYQTILHKDPLDVRSLNPAVSKDLRVIIETAMEKDKDRRYQTALGFAEDLQRFRELKPIHAKPIAPMTRAVRWAQRNTAVAVLASALFLILSASLVWMIQKNSELSSKSREVERQSLLTDGALEQAQEALLRAERVKDFLNNDLLGQVSPRTGDKDAKIRDVLDRASLRIQDRFVDAPLTESDIRHTIGRTYGDLGEYEKALVHLDRAHALSLEHRGEEHPATISCLNGLGGIYTLTRDFEKAEPVLERALRTCRAIWGEDHRDSIAIRSNLALLYTFQGRTAESESLYKELLETSRRLNGDEDYATLTIMSNLALLYSEIGRLDDAVHILTELLPTLRSTVGEEHPDTIVVLSNLAQIHNDRGRVELAEKLLHESLETHQRVLGAEHPITLETLTALAMSHKKQGRYDKAEELYLILIDAKMRAHGEDSVEPLHAMAALGGLYYLQRKLEKAEPLFKKCVAGYQRLLGKDDMDTVSSMGNLGLLYQAQGKYEAAKPLLIDALEAKRRALGPEHASTVVAMNNLGMLHSSIGDNAKAESLFLECLAIKKRVEKTPAPTTLDTMQNLSWSYHRSGKHVLARELCTDVVKQRRQVQGAEHPATLSSMLSLARMLRIADKPRESLPLLNQVLATRRRLKGDDHPATLYVSCQIAFLYSDMGEMPEAISRLTEAAGISIRAHGLSSDTRNIISNLVKILEVAGKPKEAAKWKAKLPKEEQKASEKNK